jgi:hypothetical protein
MAKRTWGALITVSLGLFAGQCAFAESVTAKIPFQFKAGKQTLPAGTYVFTFDKAKPVNLSIKASGASTVATLPIITELAMQDKVGAEVHVVFDKVENEYTIAEFWPAKADGYYLGGAGVTHTHVVVDAK